MTDKNDPLAVALFSEILMTEQLTRNRISRLLPKGMELSHFSILNHLAHAGVERSPAQLAKNFHLTSGAMTNTLHKLEWAGWVHIRPDWEDARRKMVAISPAGRAARDAAIAVISPLIGETVRDLGPENVRAAVPVLRTLRKNLSSDD